MWIIKAYLDMGGIKVERPARGLTDYKHGRHAVDISTPELLGEGLFTHLFHDEQDAHEAEVELEVKRVKERWMPTIHFARARVQVARKPTENPQEYVLRLRSMVLPVLP